MEARLRERFEAGLVTDVRAPDSSTRLTILRKRAQQDEIAELDDGALELDRRPRHATTSARSRAR